MEENTVNLFNDLKLIGQELTPTERQIVNHITGKRRTCRELEQITGFKGGDIRYYIRQARKKGVLIDSEVKGGYNVRGYKLIETESEFKRFLQIQKARVKGLEHIIYIAELQVERIGNPNQISINDYFKSLTGDTLGAINGK